MAKANSTGQASPLRFHRNRKIDAHQLPFVGLSKGKAADFWALPASGGYWGGHMAGEAMAAAYMKHLRARRGEYFGGELQSIAIAMADKRRQATSHRDKRSIDGQMVGFFGALDQWLCAASTSLGAGLERFSDAELVAKANEGLGLATEAEEIAHFEQHLK